MKTLSSRLLALSVAALFGLSARSNAQILTSTDTYAGYTPSVISFQSFSGTLYQTFGNVSAVRQMTFNVFATSTPSAASTFNATFGEWNGSSIVGSSAVTLTGLNVGATNTWGTASIGSFSGNTFQLVLDLQSFTGAGAASIAANYGYLTDSTKTYAMVLTQTGGPNTIGLGANFTDPLSVAKVGFNGGTNLGTTDWVFSQVSVYAGNQNLTGTPEASTVVALAALAFVAGVVVLRMRQRRLAPAPVAA